MKPTIYLASGSPRRREILENLGYCVLRLNADISETPHPQENATDYVARMAIEKNKAALSAWYSTHEEHPAFPILTADTTVSLDGQILGKPCNAAHAEEMLKALSGSTHQVLTAICVYFNGQRQSQTQTSHVRFKTMSPEEIHSYIASGEPLDKAGAYGIQGAGGVFVCHLEGSFTGVMGLPVYETAVLLCQIGYFAPPF